MFKGVCKKLIVGCFVGGSLLGPLTTARSQDNGRGDLLAPPVVSNGAGESDDLRARVERLEKQNRELMEMLHGQQRQQTVSTVEDSGEIRHQVQHLVSEYLQEKDKKPAAEVGKAPEAPRGVEVGSDLNMKAFWKNGVQFETPNGDFKFHFGGRVHFDMGWFDEAPALPVYKDAADFRRARFRADGTCWEVVNWVTEVDFANPNSGNATAAFTDVYAEITQLPVIGTFRVGRFKEPFSLQELVSSRYINHMERGLISQAFAPSFQLGMGMFQTLADERVTFATGVFRTNEGQETIPPGNENNFGFDNGDGEYTWTSRLTWLPIWESDGRCFLHLGGAYSYQSFNNTDNPDPSFTTRTALRIGTPVLLSTASVGALTTSDKVQLFGGEVSGNSGPFNLMSEVVVAQCGNDNSGAGPNPFYWGAYVQTGYFLTGEHRMYNRKFGAYDRQIVYEPFFMVRGSEEEGRRILCGWGAWEVIARYSYLDLRSNGVFNPTAADRSGGTGITQDITLGVNWYWNPNFKWMVNYVRGWRDSDTPNRSGIVDGLGMRVAFDF